MTYRQATTKEVRNAYLDGFNQVRISRDGRVTFRPNGDGPWLEGRWVSEYRVNEKTGEVWMQ